jgi:hypothetical protein
MPNRPNSSVNHHSKAHRSDALVAPAVPRSVRSKAAPSPSAVRDVAASGPSGSRLDQDQIDQIGALRERGVTYPEIARRLGCSDRSARRYGKGVTPRLRLPRDDDQSGIDPRALASALLTTFFDSLYDNERLRSVSYIFLDDDGLDRGGPPSTRFLSEAERLLKERLAKLSPHTLRQLSTDRLLQADFLRDVVGELYTDYVWWHREPEEMLSVLRGSDGEAWRPPWERPKSDRAPYIDIAGLDT